MPQEIIRSIDKLKRFVMIRESLSLEGKQKLLRALKLAKECRPCGCGVDEIIDPPERNAVAKTFDTQADFDSYIKQRRGIEMTPKELDAIRGYNQKPTQQDRFFVKYESADSFGNNNTTIIKKLRENGNMFCWTAFTKNVKAEGQKPEGQVGGQTPITANDSIRIVKSITFQNDTEGADILADLLNSEDLDV